MELPPQPPPNAPAPPPGDEATDSRIKMKMICLIGGVSIAGVLIFVVLPRISRGDPRDMTNAISTAKQLGIRLYEFDTDFGKFPDSTTIPAVHAATSTTLTLGSHSSNALFRQLIATGSHGEERNFWARTPASAGMPDEVYTSNATALAPGECSFSYIAGLSSSDDMDTPVVVCPLIPGTTRFDPKPFKGKAIVLRLDSSARAEPIDKSGRVMIRGMDLFDPRQPFWKGKAPDLKWPE